MKSTSTHFILVEVANIFSIDVVGIVCAKTGL